MSNVESATPSGLHGAPLPDLAERAAVGGQRAPVRRPDLEAAFAQWRHRLVIASHAFGAGKLGDTWIAIARELDAPASRSHIATLSPPLCGCVIVHRARKLHDSASSRAGESFGPPSSLRSGWRLICAVNIWKTSSVIVSHRRRRKILRSHVTTETQLSSNLCRAKPSGRRCPPPLERSQSSPTDQLDICAPGLRRSSRCHIDGRAAAHRRRS